MICIQEEFRPLNDMAVCVSNLREEDGENICTYSRDHLKKRKCGHCFWKIMHTIMHKYYDHGVNTAIFSPSAAKISIFAPLRPFRTLSLNFQNLSPPRISLKMEK